MECSGPPRDGGDRSSKFHDGLLANVSIGSAAPREGGAQGLVDALNRLRPSVLGYYFGSALLGFHCVFLCVNIGAYLIYSYMYGNHSHTKIAPLPSKITYIKMEPRSSIRNGFANGYPTHSHFYAAWTSRHQSSMIPKALKFATLQKKWPPYIHHT